MGLRFSHSQIRFALGAQSEVSLFMKESM